MLLLYWHLFYSSLCNVYPVLHSITTSYGAPKYHKEDSFLDFRKMLSVYTQLYIAKCLIKWESHPLWKMMPHTHNSVMPHWNPLPTQVRWYHQGKLNLFEDLAEGGSSSIKLLDKAGSR